MERTTDALSRNSKGSMRVLVACFPVLYAYPVRMKRIEYTQGEAVGTLTYIREMPPQKSKTRLTRCALFRCVCGNEFSAIVRSAVTGNTKTCGCFNGVTPREERTAKHHLRNHPLYRVWCSIKTRCYNPAREDFKHYGGRGIVMSSKFRDDFQAFFDHVSSLPDYEQREARGLTVERVDNSKGYERGNLRWATRKEQAQNRRNRVET